MSASLNRENTTIGKRSNEHMPPIKPVHPIPDCTVTRKPTISARRAIKPLGVNRVQVEYDKGTD
eukprot:2262983-Amphidinium_carterae.1